MQTLKAICTAAILALALTVPVYAGDIDTPAVHISATVPVPVLTSSVPTATDLLLLLVGLL
ncbi:MAG: hypothetical protein M3R69_07150 [Acidobacteriota bacterium]|nr:hypothetical protein [Acidobacteriota bacterium]